MAARNRWYLAASDIPRSTVEVSAHAAARSVVCMALTS